MVVVVGFLGLRVPLKGSIGLSVYRVPLRALGLRGVGFRV